MTEKKEAPPPRRRAIVSVLLVLLLSALLHLIVINCGQVYLYQNRPTANEQSSISITLQTLPLPEQAVALPVAKPVRPRKVRRPAATMPEAVASAAATAAPAAALAEPMTSSNAVPAEPAPSATTSAAAADNESERATPPATQQIAQDAPGIHYLFAPPPSATLEYAVHAWINHLEWHGSSTLDWKTDGQHYSVEGEVYARFFAKINFLHFLSSGDINEFGLAPELYTEKKRNRAATNTHFNRDRNVISFSASELSYPRQGGEQDRASVIWQLAAIGRGDSDRFGAGKVIDMFVAGVHDGELWRLQVSALESIRLPSGQIEAWHVVRQPRPGSYEQRLDIWLAPEMQWYPVRLQFTETNGDYLELTLDDLKTL